MHFTHPQKLYQSESRALINFREYVHELVRYLGQSFNTGSRITFHLDMAELQLDVLRAVPLGLILNETITNALKSAFIPGERGDITIELACTVGGRLSLSISDNGCGLPQEFDLDRCESPGINLIKDMCREIGGVLAVERDSGVKIMINMPLSANDISPFNHGITLSRAIENFK